MQTTRRSFLLYILSRTFSTMAKPHPDINDPNRFVLYRYNPSLEAAIVFCVAFALTTLLHIFQIIKKRTWYFIPLAVGGACKSPSYPTMFTAACAKPPRRHS